MLCTFFHQWVDTWKSGLQMERKFWSRPSTKLWVDPEGHRSKDSLVLLLRAANRARFKLPSVRKYLCNAEKEPFGIAGFIFKALRNFHVAFGYKFKPLKPFSQRWTNLCYLNFDKLRKILSTNFVFLLTSVIPVSLHWEIKTPLFFRGDIFCSNVGEIWFWYVQFFVLIYYHLPVFETAMN